MQDLIKRYFWIVGAAAVMLCAVFAAKATGHIIEAKFLGDATHAPKLSPVARATDHAAEKPAHDKDGGQFATRNMFCSECTPPVAVATTISDPSSIQVTSLPLVLLATNVGPEASQSYATVVNTENQKQGAYGVGDQLPGASGKIKAIKFKYVDFENNGRTERVMLVGVAPPPPTPVAAEPVAQNDDNKDDLQASIDNGIKKTGDNSYEIDKSLVDKALANPMALAKGARVVPAVKNGKPMTIKYSIR